MCDAALIKGSIPIHENWNAEAPGDVFNVANHALFGQPSGNVSCGSAAPITSLSGDQRVMQFVVRLNGETKHRASGDILYRSVERFS